MSKETLICIIFILVLIAGLAYGGMGIVKWKSERFTIVEFEALLEKEGKIYEMLNAKMDCERLVPRTQECILVYDYVPVSR